MAKKKSMAKTLKSPSGALPTANKKVFEEIVGKLIETWGIERPQEIMMVNRMVSTWMKLQRAEELLNKYDLFFEQRDKSGNLIGIKMNECAYYVSKLDSDFRAYYRGLQTKIKTEEKEGINDLIDFMKAKTVEPTK